MYAAWCAINRPVYKTGSGRNTYGLLGLLSVSQGYNTNVEDRQSSALLVGPVLPTARVRLARYTETASMHIPYVNSSAYLIIYFRVHPQRSSCGSYGPVIHGSSDLNFPLQVVQLALTRMTYLRERRSLLSEKRLFRFERWPDVSVGYRSRSQSVG